MFYSLQTSIHNTLDNGSLPVFFLIAKCYDNIFYHWHATMVYREKGGCENIFPWQINFQSLLVIIKSKVQRNLDA